MKSQRFVCDIGNTNYSYCGFLDVKDTTDLNKNPYRNVAGPQCMPLVTSEEGGKQFSTINLVPPPPGPRIIDDQERLFTPDIFPKLDETYTCSIDKFKKYDGQSGVGVMNCITNATDEKSLWDPKNVHFFQFHKMNSFFREATLVTTIDTLPRSQPFRLRMSREISCGATCSKRIRRQFTIPTS